MNEVLGLWIILVVISTAVLVLLASGILMIVLWACYKTTIHSPRRKLLPDGEQESSVSNANGVRGRIISNAYDSPGMTTRTQTAPSK